MLHKEKFNLIICNTVLDILFDLKKFIHIKSNFDSLYFNYVFYNLLNKNKKKDVKYNCNS